MTDYQNALSVSSLARPKRVAVLIDPEEVSPDELDEITNWCCSYWGGGYWPIIPSDGQTLSADWWSVLEAVDPDVVYTICDLRELLHDQIHRKIAPAQLINLGTPQIARRNQRLPVTFADVLALEVGGIPRYRAEQRVYYQTRLIVPSVGDESGVQDRRFLYRNFGLLNSTKYDLSAFDRLDFEWLELSENDKFAILNRYTTGGQFIWPRDLSKIYAPRPFDLAYNDFASGFQLVIGDTVDDVLFSWNRSLTSSSRKPDTLWIDNESAKDKDFMLTVAGWIKRVFGNHDQEKIGTVVSYSAESELLQDVAAVISEVAWLRCATLQLTRGQFPFTPRHPIYPLHSPRLTQELPSRTDIAPLAAQGGLIGIPRPPFAIGTSGEQGWMVDLDVEYQIGPARFSNRSDRWRLPRRARLAHLFSSHRAQGRVVRGGLPSLSVSAREQRIPLRVPSEDELLAYLLEPPPSIQHDDRAPNEVPRSKYVDVRTSEQGLRFRGMINLFGGVASAGRIFEDRFWRTIFLEGAGKPKDDVERRAGVILTELRNGLPTLVRGGADQITQTEGELAKFARKIATAVYQVTAAPRTFTVKQLRDAFGKIMASERITTDTGERRVQFGDTAEHDVECLLAAKVLLQGITLSCPICGIGEWRIVDDLESTMSCRNCTSLFPLPPDKRWEFRINGLVQSALSRDAILPLLDAVYHLTLEARDMAVVIAPQELREVYDGPVVTDLDVIVVVDGRFVIGEVKSHPDAFSDRQIQYLLKVTREIRPDSVLVAAPGDSWPSDVEARLEEMKRKLEGLDIDLITCLLHW